MIKLVKTKNEMIDGSPHRIVTFNIDLEDIRLQSKSMTKKEFYEKVGEMVCKNFEQVLQCKS